MPRHVRLALAPILLGLLPACVAVRSTVAPGVAPSAASGYVAGFFDNESRWGFGLGLVDAAGAELVIPFGDPALKAAGGRLAMIEVPPGEYRIGHWVTYATATKSRESKTDLPASHPAARRFTVKPGEVVVLGAFSAESSSSSARAAAGGTVLRFEWTVTPKRLAERQATAAFREGYPAFQAAPVSCLLCTK